MTLARGQHLIGRTLGSCVLERLLGYGGSSAVFLARQHSPDREVAVKVFLPRTVMDIQMQKEFYSRFLSEAEAASKLDHANILPIYAYGEQDGIPYIVMPYMEGGTLSEYIARHGPLSVQEALWYIEQIASALDYAHAMGCVHCDVKPANMLLDSEGHVMLSDFGIARAVQIDEASGQLVAKSPGSLMGTPDYISPEQALGRPLDGRSDIYSLGITLFYMLAKRLPFKADSSIALALLHLHEAPPALTLLRGDISPAMDSVVHKALAKEPDERFQTAGEFSAAFAQAIAASDNMDTSTSSGKRFRALPSLPQPAPAIYQPMVRVKRLGRRNVILTRLAAAAALLLTLVGAAGFSTRFVAPFFTGTSFVVQTPSPTVDSTSIDYLADRDNWPLSSTYFYDNPEQRYHVLNKSARDVAFALYRDHEFDDFRLTVTMSEIHGLSDGVDYYGVVFRCTEDQSHFYLFEVITSSTAQYMFLRHDSNGQFSSLGSGTTSVLQPSPGKSNTVTIEAHGNTFNFQINGKPLGKSVTDPSKTPLLSGQVGFYVEDQGAEVAFSHLYIHELN